MLKKLGKKGLLIAGLLLVFLLTFFAERNHQYTGAEETKIDWVETEEEGMWSTQCFSRQISKGKYQVSIYFESKEDTQWDIIDNKQVNADNSAGRVLASGTLGKGEGWGHADITVDNRTADLALRLSGREQIQDTVYWSITCIADDSADAVFIFLVLSAVLVALYCVKDYWKVRMQLVMAAAGLAVSVPYFTSYLANGHDLVFHLNRIEGIAEGLLAGQFPVRMNTVFNQGYGFLNSLLYPEAFLYIPGSLCALGGSIMTAYKFMIVLLNLSCALIGFYSFKRLLNSERNGMICALIYVLNPYRLTNLFIRGALGEAIAAVFLPLLVLGVYELVCRNYKKWWIIAAAATGLIQSHILSVEISLIFVVIFMIVNIREFGGSEGKQRILSALKAGGSTILLNLWFFLPFLEQFGNNYELLNQDSVTGISTLYLFQMFLSNFKMSGYNVAYGMQGEMPLTIGPVLAAGTVVFSYYAYVKRNMSERNRKIGNCALVFGAISCYMASEFFPWNLALQSGILKTILNPIQFPWRMLGFAALFLGIVTAIAVGQLLEEKQSIVAGILAVITVQMALVCMDGYMTESSVYLRNRDEAVTSSSSIDYYEKGGQYEYMKETGRQLRLDSAIQISDYEQGWASCSFQFSGADMAADRVIRLPYYNYDCYRAYLNGEELPVESGENQITAIQIPEGVDCGSVVFEYNVRKMYRVGDCVSMVFVLGICMMLLCRRKQRKGKSHL